jgi:hypothetical protein
MWKKVVMASFKVLPWYLLAGTEENHKKKLIKAGNSAEI